MKIISDILAWIHDNERPAASIISLGGAIVLAGAKWLVAARTRVEWSRAIDVEFNTGQTDSINVESFSIYNAGRKAAEDVEVSLGSRPAHLNLYPNVTWEITENPDTSVVVKVPTLNGGERIFISLLSQGATSPTISHLRYKGGNGQSVKVELMNVDPAWYIWVKRIVMFIGVVAILAAIVSLIIFVLPKPTQP